MTVEFVQLLQDMLGDLEGNPEPIEVKIFGDDLPTLAGLAERVAERMKAIDGVVDVVAPQRGNPELDVRIDPTRAAKRGFTVEQVSGQLSTGLLGNVATAFRRGDRLVDVRVRFPDASGSRSTGCASSRSPTRTARSCRCRAPRRCGSCRARRNSTART